MTDYKEMYFKLFRATTQAIDILVKAQQDCEELTISEPSPKLTALPRGMRPANKPEKSTGDAASPVLSRF